MKKIYAPSDIKWIKNVTNTEGKNAYMDVGENTFSLHFPTKKRKNVLDPKVDEIILLYQKINSIRVFTHLVTPVSNELGDEKLFPKHRYFRKVKILAKTDLQNVIHRSSTLWNKVNMRNLGWGDAHEIIKINSKIKHDELLFDIWQRFNGSFTTSETLSATNLSSYLNELENTNPEISVSEGGLRLVEHFFQERVRDPKIIKLKKEEAIRNNTTKCEVCNFSFQEKYGKEFIECHHRTPIATGGVRETKPEDLALVCSNCHRMLHTQFVGEFLTVENLRSRIKGK